MWVFAGTPSRNVATQPQSASILIETNSPLIEQNLIDRVSSRPQPGPVMPSVQIIVTLASLAAVASCFFGVSWVGLAPPGI